MSNIKILMDNIQHIEDTADFDFSNKIRRQGLILDSANYNTGMNFFESKMNVLYEKTRILEDISTYAKNSLRLEVINRKIKFKELLESVEATRDSVRSKGFVTKNVPMNEAHAYSKRDRDGTVIDSLVSVNGNISLHHGESVDIIPEAVSVKREVDVFLSNEASMLRGKEYRTFYMLEGPATNGVKEEIEVSFEDAPRYITHVISDRVNVDKYSVHIKNGSKIINIAGNPDTGFSKTEATSIVLTIIDESYRQVVYEYDRQRASKDFWHKVGEKENASELGEHYVFDLERESGLAQYKIDYEKYLSEYAAWSAAKAASEARNAALEAEYNNRYAQWEVDMESPEVKPIYDEVVEKVQIGIEKIKYADPMYDSGILHVIDVEDGNVNNLVINFNNLRNAINK